MPRMQTYHVKFINNQPPHTSDCLKSQLQLPVSALLKPNLGYLQSQGKMSGFKKQIVAFDS